MPSISAIARAGELPSPSHCFETFLLHFLFSATPVPNLTSEVPFLSLSIFDSCARKINLRKVGHRKTNGALYFAALVARHSPRLPGDFVSPLFLFLSLSSPQLSYQSCPSWRLPGMSHAIRRLSKVEGGSKTYEVVQRPPRRLSWAYLKFYSCFQGRAI